MSSVQFFLRFVMQRKLIYCYVYNLSTFMVSKHIDLYKWNYSKRAICIQREVLCIWYQPHILPFLFCVSLQMFVWMYLKKAVDNIRFLSSPQSLLSFVSNRAKITFVFFFSVFMSPSLFFCCFFFGLRLQMFVWIYLMKAVVHVRMPTRK